MTRRSGFTIVELLIVIVVIGILAAITLVAFGGIRDRANDASVQSDLSSLSKQFALFHADSGRYPWNATELEGLDVAINTSAYMQVPATQYNLVPCVATDGSAYAIAAISASGKRLYVTSGGSVREYTGAGTWVGASQYATMCSNSLAGSTVISSGSGYSGVWRNWTR